MELFNDRVCYNCNISVDKKKLKYCARCKVAEYCSDKCRIADFKKVRIDKDGTSLPNHRDMCLKIVTLRDEMANCEKELQNLGINPREPSQLLICGPQDFAAPFKEAANICIEVYRMALAYKSTNGMYMAIYEAMMTLTTYQPYSLHIRYLLPLMFITIKRSDEAYRFIKCWMSTATEAVLDPNYEMKACKMYSPFQMPIEPLQRYTIDTANPQEDIFAALNIDPKKTPYLFECCFYFSYLACIKHVQIRCLYYNMLRTDKKSADGKILTLNARKVEYKVYEEEEFKAEAMATIKAQREHFHKYLDYVETHFPGVINYFFDEKNDVIVSPKALIDTLGPKDIKIVKLVLPLFRDFIQFYYRDDSKKTKYDILAYMAKKHGYGQDVPNVAERIDLRRV